MSPTRSAQAVPAPRRMVAFDLDGTLVDQPRAARQWGVEFVDAHNLDVDAGMIGDVLAQRRPKGEVFTELVGAHDLHVTPQDMWADYRQRMPYLVRVTGQDRQALINLRAAGWVVGIITNGTGSEPGRQDPPDGPGSTR